jgi:anti-anti-sigma regulatory factor
MTRRQAEVTSAAGLDPFGHVAWGYRDRSEFLARAAEYIADGLARNQRVLYACDASAATLRNELDEMGFADAVRTGQIAVTPVKEHYRFVPGTDVVDAEATVADGVAAMKYVVAAGCSGCRAVVDGAVLVRTPEQRAAFARLEYLVDQQMAVLPFSALCAYNLELLGDPAKELICLHPLVSRGATGFRIYAEPGIDFALAGEIDAADGDAFAIALQRIWPLAAGDEVVIDARALDFVAHPQLFALDQLAGADGRQVVLRTSRRLVARLAELLELSNVRVETQDLADAS